MIDAGKIQSIIDVVKDGSNLSSCHALLEAVQKIQISSENELLKAQQEFETSRKELIKMYGLLLARMLVELKAKTKESKDKVLNIQKQKYELKIHEIKKILRKEFGFSLFADFGADFKTSAQKIFPKENIASNECYKSLTELNNNVEVFLEDKKFGLFLKDFKGIIASKDSRLEEISISPLKVVLSSYANKREALLKLQKNDEQNKNSIKEYSQKIAEELANIVLSSPQDQNSKQNISENSKIKAAKSLATLLNENVELAENTIKSNDTLKIAHWIEGLFKKHQLAVPVYNEYLKLALERNISIHELEKFPDDLHQDQEINDEVLALRAKHYDELYQSLLFVRNNEIKALIFDGPRTEATALTKWLIHISSMTGRGAAEYDDLIDLLAWDEINKIENNKKKGLVKAKKLKEFMGFTARLYKSFANAKMKHYVGGSPEDRIKFLEQSKRILNQAYQHYHVPFSIIKELKKNAAGIEIPSEYEFHVINERRHVEFQKYRERTIKKKLDKLKHIIAFSAALCEGILGLAGVISLATGLLALPITFPVILIAILIGLAGFTTNYVLFLGDIRQTLKILTIKGIKSQFEGLSKGRKVAMGVMLVLSVATSVLIAMFTVAGFITAFKALALIGALAFLGAAAANPIGIAIICALALISAIAFFASFTISGAKFVRTTNFTRIRNSLLSLFYEEDWKYLPTREKVRHIISCILRGLVLALTSGIAFIVSFILVAAGKAEFVPAVVNITAAASVGISNLVMSVLNIVSGVVAGLSFVMQASMNLRSIQAISLGVMEKITQAIGIAAKDRKCKVVDGTGLELKVKDLLKQFGNIARSPAEKLVLKNIEELDAIAINFLIKRIRLNRDLRSIEFDRVSASVVNGIINNLPKLAHIERIIFKDEVKNLDEFQNKHHVHTVVLNNYPSPNSLLIRLNNVSKLVIENGEIPNQLSLYSHITELHLINTNINKDSNLSMLNNITCIKFELINGKQIEQVFSTENISSLKKVKIGKLDENAMVILMKGILAHANINELYIEDIEDTDALKAFLKAIPENCDKKLNLKVNINILLEHKSLIHTEITKKYSNTKSENLNKDKINVDIESTSKYLAISWGIKVGLTVLMVILMILNAIGMAGSSFTQSAQAFSAVHKGIFGDLGKSTSIFYSVLAFGVRYYTSFSVNFDPYWELAKESFYESRAVTTRKGITQIASESDLNEKDVAVEKEVCKIKVGKLEKGDDVSEVKLKISRSIAGQRLAFFNSRQEEQRKNAGVESNNFASAEPDNLTSTN